MIEDAIKENIKCCCIIFNLGGPNNLNEVEKFLFNLFYDKRIITLSKIPRFILAKLISKLRKKKAKEIYKLIGGKSPINENTLNQAIALQNILIKDFSKNENNSINWRVFYSMRHSSPNLEDILQNMSDFDPQKIILLPLYPQYSTTTTESFFDKWQEVSYLYKNKSEIIPIYDYHDNQHFISSCVNLILDYIWENIKDIKNIRFLFSAHGLPESIVKAGDPYQKQVEKSYKIIVEDLEKNLNIKLDTRLCYQSKVGPKKWITPSLETEIENSARDNKDVAIFPIAFVSEHSETLVELDMEYLHIANKLGIKKYFRIPTLGINKDFIDCLAKIAFNAAIK